MSDPEPEDEVPLGRFPIVRKLMAERMDIPARVDSLAATMGSLERIMVSFDARLRALEFRGGKRKRRPKGTKAPSSVEPAPPPPESPTESSA